MPQNNSFAFNQSIGLKECLSFRLFWDLNHHHYNTTGTNKLTELPKFQSAVSVNAFMVSLKSEFIQNNVTSLFRHKDSGVIFVQGMGHADLLAMFLMI